MKQAGALLFLIMLEIIFSAENLYSIPRYSDYGSPYITVYGPKDYNANNQNRAIIQDSRGILYFGNNDGVLLHDGKNWEIVPVSNKTVIRSLAIDANDRIYVGAVNEFGYIDYNETGKPIYISLINKLDEKHRQFGDLGLILSNDYGVYFCGKAGIYLYKDDTIRIIDAQITQATSIRRGNSIIAFSQNQGLVTITGETVTPIPGTENILTILGVFSFLIPYSEDTILLGGINGKLYTFDLNRNQLSPFKTEMDEYAEHNILANGIRLDENRFAFTTFEGGIYILDKQGRLEQIINSSRGLPENQMERGILLDRDGNLWTCDQSGISHIELGTGISKFDNKNGLNGSILIFHDLDNILYIGTMNGIFCLSEYEISLENDSRNFQKLHSTSWGVWDMIEMNGSIIAGDYSQLIAIKNRKAYEIPVLDKNGSIVKNLGLLLDLGKSTRYENYIFAATQNKGIYILKIEEYDEMGIPVAAHIKKVIHDVKGQMVFEILDDKKNGFWVHVYTNGLWHISFTDFNNFEYTIEKYDINDGLPSNNWNMPLELEGRIVIATDEGLYTIEENGTKGYKLILETTIGNALKDHSFTQLIKDQTERYWTTSRNGTMIYGDKNPDGIFVLNKTPLERMESAITNFYIDKKGIIWIGGPESIHRYDPNKKTDIDKPFKTILKKVINNRENTVLNDFSGRYYQPENERAVEYTYENNSFLFEYEAVWFIKQEDTQYRFQLYGFDQNWSTWSGENKKEYTNLTEGTYKFMVKAINIYGTESNIAEYHFIILPPWYRTPFAFAGYIIIFILLLILGIRINNSRLIAKNEELERIVKERTSELEKLTIVASETDNGVIILDTDGTIEWINNAYSQIHDITLDEFKQSGKTTIFDVNVNTDCDLRKLFKTSISAKKSITYKSTFMKTTGEPGITQTTITPIFDKKSRKIKKFVAIESDITELSLAQKEAVTNAHKAGMADVAINTIHSVGNILNSLRASTETIQEITKFPVFTKLEKANELLRNNLPHLESFISNDPKGQKLVEYYFQLENSFSEEHSDIEQKVISISTKIDAISNILATHHNYIGDQVSMIETYDLKHIVDDAISINEQYIERNNIQVETRFTKVPLVTLHKSKVMQAIMNVVINAGDAMSHLQSADRKLIFSLEQNSDDSVLLKITDTGCGFLPEDNQKIFAHGYTTKESGRGFGLHNAANYLTEMGGKMWAESEGPGKGTTIFMSFRAEL